MCVSTDGFKSELKVMDVHGLLNAAMQLFQEYNAAKHLYYMGAFKDSYMTEQLIEKLMKLDQLLKNQEEFMGSFAHEMKTPLTSIIGYADLMRMEALSQEEQK